MQPDRREQLVERALRQMRNQPLREIERASAIVGDDAGAADAPCGLLGLEHAHFRAAQPHRRRRDLRFAVFTHVGDQRFDEMRGRQQGVALEIDDQIDVAELPERLGAALGAVAAVR